MDIQNYPGMVFVVYDGIKPVGMATLTQQGEVRDFLVEESHRGQGYGKELIAKLVEYITANFNPEAGIFFNTGADNETIAKFAGHYGCIGTKRFMVRVKDYIALKEGA